jgi:hypothetical protein
MLLSGRDRPHGARHDVLASLAIYIELFVLYVKFDEGQPRVEMVTAVKTSGVNTGVSRRLYVTSLKAAVTENALTVGPGTMESVVTVRNWI